MTAIPLPRHSPAPGDDAPGPVLAGHALRAWLAAECDRPLAITGPVGIGRTTALRGLAEDLAGSAEHVVLATPVAEGEDGAHVLGRVRRTVETLARAGDRRRPVVLVDDVDRVPADDLGTLLTALRALRPAGLVVTTTSAAGLDDAILLALPTLTGPLDVSVADAAALQAGALGRCFLDRLRKHNPVHQPDLADLGRVAEICASSFGIPVEVGVLAELVDRHGVAAVADAVTETRPRHRLAALVGHLGQQPPALAGDHVLVLASVFASPGGSSADMLRRSLPRCDVDGALGDLVRGGLVHCVGQGDDGGDGEISDRYLLRTSAAPVGAWCAAQAEVSLAAIRHAHADYLHERIRRMVGGLHGLRQREAFAEFRRELPNLRCDVAELMAMGRHSQALSLLSDALPLLVRTCGLRAVLADVLHLVRVHEPSSDGERALLARVAVRVFAASDELELGSAFLDVLEDLPADVRPEPDGERPLLRMLTSDGIASASDMAGLTRCLEDHRAARDLAAITEMVGELLPRLVRSGDLERAEDDCRALLVDATRCGDDYLAGIVLLWRATVAASASADEARVLVERALGKLRPLGPDAVLSAVSGVVANRHLRNLTQGCVDLAMLVGALSRASLADDGGDTHPTVLPGIERRLADRIGFRAVRRWAAEGAAAEPVDLLVEMLHRRWVEGSSATVELRHSSGVAERGLVDAAGLSGCSPLTNREAQVASLVATGLTNKQVAFRLQISEWTVINHLRQVMRKLDCTSRVQVTRWVTTHVADPAVT